MKKLFLMFSFILSCLANATPITVSFDDLTGNSFLPGNYGGLDWGDSKWIHYDVAQPPYYASSGSQRLYNASGALGYIKFNQDVTLNSLWLAGYGYNQFVEGFNNGVKVFESVHMPSNRSSFGILLTLNWALVDEIRIQSSDGSYNHYVLDDLTYTLPVAPVPDAGSSAMLLSCALASFGVLRRKQ